MPEDAVFFPQHLQNAGYRTALFGKLHTSSRLFEADHRHPNDGFDEYEWAIEAAIHLDSPFNGYSRWLKERDPAFYEDLLQRGRNVLHHPQEVHFTHWAADRTIDFIDRSVQGGDQANPFFVCMSVFDPHNPYEDYPLEMLDRIDDKGMPPPLSDPRRNRPEGIERERRHSYLGAFEEIPSADISSMRRGYFASVALIDIEVGRVLDALGRRGISDNTLVLFLSDHGDMLGDHDLVVKGGYFYDACSRVPFLIRWPGHVPAGTVVAAPVQPHDIARTILSAAAVPETRYDREMPDSRDVVPLAKREIDRVHDYTITAYRNSGISDEKRPWDPPIHATMIYDGRYKLSVYHGELAEEDAPARGSRGELYDIHVDPDELNDLFDDSGYVETRLRLTEQLNQWFFRKEQNSAASRGGEMRPGPADQLDNRLTQ
jgi:arylsulfatase